MAGGRVGKGCGRRVVDAEDRGDHRGILTKLQNAIGAIENGRRIFCIERGGAKGLTHFPHDDRGFQPVPRNVADRKRDDAFRDGKRIVPVAADFGFRTRQVCGVKFLARKKGELLGQHGALQRIRHPMFARVQARVVDGERVAGKRYGSAGEDRSG